MSFSKTRWLPVLAPLTIAVMYSLRWVDGHLKAAETACHCWGAKIEAPVICFEFAWTTEKADAMLAAWSGKLHYMTFGLGLDFLFLLLYPIVLFLVLQLVAAHVSTDWLKRLAAFFAPVIFASGFFDAVENVCLLRYIFGHHAEWLLKTAGVCAGIKFGLLFIGGLIILLGLPTLFKVSWKKLTQYISKNLRHS